MIRFSDKQWDRVIGNYRKWWNGDLGRPILPLIVTGADTGRSKPATPLLSFENSCDFSVSAEAIIDRFDYELSTYEFYGDSFPFVNLSRFGPGIMAAFMGVTPHAAKETVWFDYPKQIPITDLHFEYDPNNIWLNRLKDIYRAGTKKWGGDVCMCMTDLGGNMDILAHFRGTENLLFEVLDYPDEVKRLCVEITELWLKYFWELTDIIKDQRAFSGWDCSLAEKPSYILQCDFSYMISADLFKKYVHDDLADTSVVLDKPFYHLDGMGEIKHLDDILSIDGIKGIQWVPGSGEPEQRDWSELYAKISSAGKKIMAGYGFESYLDEILKVAKKPDDLMKMTMYHPIKEKETALKHLERFGAL